MQKGIVEIKKLPAEHWKDFRDLRLEALQNAPIAFGSSYEEEKGFPEAEWKKRMNNTFFALYDGNPAGTISCVIENRPKIKHIANIYGVYVKEEFRGLGLANKLFKHVLQEAEQNAQITKIKLTVNPEQQAAVRLYEKFGFEIVGSLKNELFVNGTYHDELVMEKYIRH